MISDCLWTPNALRQTASMTSPRWKSLTLIIVLSGIAGCAGVPAAIPKAPSPADLIKAIPQGNNTTLVNVAPPSHNFPTLLDFLGVTRCCYEGQACCTYLQSEAAFCFPALGGVIAPGAGIPTNIDPANQPPSVAAAAGIKAKEGEAQAKIQALRYLAEFGCGCYNADGSVEKAFLSALDDCTEAVRYEAVMALRKVAKCGCHHCSRCTCNEKACCSEKIQKKLWDMAYGTDDMGCPKEPSERVRRLARLVLCECGPPIVKPEPAPEKPVPKPEGPKEGPRASAAATHGATGEEKATLPPPIPPPPAQK